MQTRNPWLYPRNGLTGEIMDWEHGYVMGLCPRHGPFLITTVSDLRGPHPHFSGCARCERERQWAAMLASFDCCGL